MGSHTCHVPTYNFYLHIWEAIFTFAFIGKINIVANRNREDSKHCHYGNTNCLIKRLILVILQPHWNRDWIVNWLKIGILTHNNNLVYYDGSCFNQHSNSILTYDNIYVIRIRTRIEWIDAFLCRFRLVQVSAALRSSHFHIVLSVEKKYNLWQLWHQH